MWAVRHGNEQYKTGKEAILDNLHRNWNFYLKNKELFQQNHQMLELMELSNLGNVGVVYINGDTNETFQNEMSCSDEENMKDISYKAYFHYFVARQNKKRAEEFHIKIRDNSLERAEIYAERKDEGKYLEECERIKEEYETREYFMKNMDRLNWWGLREAGKKLYKVYL